MVKRGGLLGFWHGTWFATITTARKLPSSFSSSSSSSSSSSKH